MNRRSFLQGSLRLAAGATLAAGSMSLKSRFSVANYKGYQGIAIDDPATRFIHPALASNSRDDVGVNLVCVFDSSGSVNDTEYQIQLESMAEAIESPDFIETVLLGPGSIAITFLEFGEQVRVCTGWADFRKGDEWKFKALAEEILAIERVEASGDFHNEGLRGAMVALDHAPWRAHRTIVDFMTDGDNDVGKDGELPGMVNELAIRYGATVNALITYDRMMIEDHGMTGYEEWSRHHLVTKPGYIKPGGIGLDAGFLIAVGMDIPEDNSGSPIASARASADAGASGSGLQTFKFRDEMKRAFRRKIMLEVARGPEFEEFQRTMLASAGASPLIPVLK